MKTPTVKQYQLTTKSGKKIRQATKVILPSGREILFTEKLGKKAALKAAGWTK